MKKDYFVCEICKEKTPYDFEGTEPKTCCMCMPKCEDNEEIY